MDEPSAQIDPPAPASAEGMRKTVPQEAFSADGLRAHLARTGPTGAVPLLPDPRAGTAPLLERPSLAERLHRFGGRAPGPPLPRFEVDRVLGVGATARVYSVRDRNLDRAVAVKFLSEGIAGAEAAAIEHFVQEAQITASLEHPNVLPVHELDVNDAGQVYFTMKKIDGRSLGALIEQSSPERREPPLSDFNAVVNLMLGVCQALAYAHARGVVHQDVKPENIMVGDFGEVLLVDWGSAARIRSGEPPRLYGTPLYMSPEQARREGVDERSDVYCVGATLFHALTLRPPTWSDDAEEFWRLKREGAIQPPTPAERARAPRLLLDIALKALAARPEDRYVDAAALLADLRGYQAGLAVSAHRDTWLEALARWHRRHWRALWATTAVAAVVLALGGALYGEKLKEIATWGAPKVEERFADDSWRGGWQRLDGGFERRDGRLVSTGDTASLLVWPHKLWGPVAIEYEAEILPGNPPGDISAFWTRDLGRDEKDPLHGAYTFQVGAFDGAYTAIRDGEGRHLASSPFHPEIGRRYRIRVEIDDYRMTLAVDGRVVCEWTDTMRFDGGYLGLYAFYKGKAYDEVRIYGRGVAQKVPATAIGDALMRATAGVDAAQRGAIYDQAFEQYRRVVESQPGTAVEREARYKQGLCRWEQQRYDDALAAWAPLRASEYGLSIRLYRIDRRFAEGDHDGALAELEEIALSGDGDARKLAAMRWARCIEALRAAKDLPGVERWLAGHDRSFPDEQVVDVTAADALADLHRLEELLRRYPQQRRQCAWALVDLGRADEVLERFPEQVSGARFAMFATGQFDALERASKPGEWFLDDLQVKEGRAAEVVARHPKGIEYWQALCALGREQEALAETARNPELHPRTLMLFGHEDQVALGEDSGWRLRARLVMGEPATVLATADPGSRGNTDARLMLAVDAFARGDGEEGRRLAEGIDSQADCVDEWMFLRFALPMLEHPRDPAAWSRALAPALAARWTQSQLPWYMASWMAGATDDAAYLAQPWRQHAPARLHLLRAMRADREGRAADARASYAAWLARPRWQRGDDVQPVMEYFAKSRLQALAPR